MQALTGGTDPYTSEPLPEESLLSNPDTVEALRAATIATRRGRLLKKPRELPAQGGKAWDTAEEEILIREFEADETVAAIARTHGRTRGAIKARLASPLGHEGNWPSLLRLRRAVNGFRSRSSAQTWNRFGIDHLVFRAAAALPQPLAS